MSDKNIMYLYKNPAFNLLIFYIYLSDGVFLIRRGDNENNNIFLWSYCISIFLVVLSYLCCFLADSVVPNTINSGTKGNIFLSALINVGLITVFAAQHTIMARSGFKRWWVKVVPEIAERSTYVLFSSTTLAFLFLAWQPMPDLVWNIENKWGVFAFWGMFYLGWFIVLLSTFLINHFDLFGLRQVYLHLRGKKYENLHFTVLWLYKFVRHPLMLGFLIVFWSTPKMTAGHLLFAIAMTIYILIALQFEERDNIKAYGESYREYKKQVPMLLPFLRKK